MSTILLSVSKCLNFFVLDTVHQGFSGGSDVKNLPTVWEIPHSSSPAWRIPWTEEPGGLESVELQRVGYD